MTSQQPIFVPQSRPSDGSRNLWCDGRFLVLRKKDHKFPERCVMTNSRADLVKHRLMTHNPAVDHLNIGFDCFVNRGWRSTSYRRSDLALILLVLGVAGFIGSGVLMLKVDEDGPWGWLPTACMVLAGIVIGAGVLRYMFAKQEQFLFGERLDEEGHYWILGANADFLKELPDWKLTGPLGAPGVLPRR